MKAVFPIRNLAAVSLAAATLGFVSADAKQAEKSVKVSDFGWNAEDATEIVQKALDSGAKRVVFDNKGAPWIVRPVKARSNTDIVFEDGVELLAKKGQYYQLYTGAFELE